MPLSSPDITARRKPALSAGAPTTAPSPPSEAAFRSLIKTLGLLKRVMEPHFARFGISGAQWAVVRTLHRSEEQGQPALRLTDLGDRLIVRPASVTGVIDRLQRMGLVARTASPDDHRAKIVRLTPGGRDLVRRVLEHHPAQMHRVLEVFSASEQADLQRLLDRLTTHLERLPTGAAVSKDRSANSKSNPEPKRAIS
jgi:DNA-binding MarR family transcriptional regulator